MGTVKDEKNNNTITTKARYWVGVGYLENMIADWQEQIDNIVQLPYSYCIHDKDVNSDDESRKTHVHILLCFTNTTTYKNALSIFNELSVPGAKAFNTCCKVHNVRHMYNYLIHDTDDSRKKHKYPYEPSERICGNNFDIGCFEQISLTDKKIMRQELAELIYNKGFKNYLDFYVYVCKYYDSEYEEIVISYSGHFERLTKGNFQKWKFAEISQNLKVNDN